MTSAAVTWTDGISLSAPMSNLLVDVKLYSQTGFTAKARNVIKFIAPNRRLCGLFGQVGKSPGALVALPKK